MYRHHSSARVGVGKRGHGGREYRPPRPRKDPNSTPPPLKECSCLLQIDIPEYLQPEPTGRSHVSLGGREKVQEFERFLRANCTVHLVIPGRKQAGPVAIAGRSHEETLPAATYLLSKLRSPWTDFVEGRIQLNVKNAQAPTITGRWRCPQIESSDGPDPPRPICIFESEKWNVLACMWTPSDPTADTATEVVAETTDNTELNRDSSLASQTSEQSDDNDDDWTPFLEVLRICLDNVILRVGNLQGLFTFVHDFPPMALVCGDPRHVELISEEIANVVNLGKDI
ncbi:unnamed protein product [Cylindrotheca closterium]|uniref:Uncharacterized protein n=1 Tax=Cylindrotheca closterium TaxID=2856 RepID=A0AAD2CS39_9STRA|nr:unnamed protein product [Cylindrotheca closterium]